MGIFISCCRENATAVVTPDMEVRNTGNDFVSQEVRRHQQAQAAEKRLKELESRGVKDPERVKRMQQRTEVIQKRQEEASKHDSGSGLKWQVS